MTYVIRAHDLIGLPVVAIASGEDIAEIRDVVYDAAAHRLVGFTLNKRGFFAGRMREVLPVGSVAAIGRDAVMVGSDTVIGESETPDALQSDAGSSVIGTRVLSADGSELGKVKGVVLATGPLPAAVGYEIDVTEGADDVFVPISAQMVLSEDNLLLPEGATEFVRNDLAGFGAAIESYRDSTLARGAEQ